MQFTVTVGAKCEGISDGIRAVVGETDLVMHFKVRATVWASEGRRMVTAFTMSGSSLQDSADYVGIAYVANPLHNDSVGRRGGDGESRGALVWCRGAAACDLLLKLFLE